MNSRFKKTAVIMTALSCTILFAAESCDDPAQKTAHDEGQALTEKAFAQQSASVPYPADKLKDSLERRNLARRLLDQNDPNKIGYVYFFPFGSDTPFGYWTIKGKVSSTQSQMTPSDTIEYACEDGLSGCQAVVVQAPGDDGSYSENEKGVFFYTTEGAMVQVCEECYFYQDQPVPTLGNLPELNSKR